MARIRDLPLPGYGSGPRINNSSDPNIHSLADHHRSSSPLSYSGDGGDFGGRLAKVEARLNKIEKNLATIKAELKHMATKEDIKDMQLEMAKEQKIHLRWLIGVVVSAFGIISYILLTA